MFPLIRATFVWQIGPVNCTALTKYSPLAHCSVSKKFSFFLETFLARWKFSSTQVNNLSMWIHWPTTFKWVIFNLNTNKFITRCPYFRCYSVNEHSIKKRTLRNKLFKFYKFIEFFINSCKSIGANIFFSCVVRHFLISCPEHLNTISKRPLIIQYWFPLLPRVAISTSH